MLSTESRMRGDMQVRFGGRYGKTYCRKAVRRSVPSLRLGKGGNIIALAQELYASDSVPYLLDKIAQQALHVRPVSFSFRQQSSTQPSFQQLEVVPLSSPALYSYLQERGINTELAKRECKEVRFVNNGKQFFAVGFPNASGGYEVRNKYFKGCIAPKDITYIRQKGEPRETCYMFEGFMDYLSFLTLRQKSCLTYPDLDKQDYIILNSVSNLSKALYPLGNYEHIHCFFDNDAAGMKAVQELHREYGWRVRDSSRIYSNYKDLNDYLTGKKLSQSLEFPQPTKQTERQHDRSPKVFRQKYHSSIGRFLHALLRNAKNTLSSKGAMPLLKPREPCGTYARQAELSNEKM